MLGEFGTGEAGAAPSPPGHAAHRLQRLVVIAELRQRDGAGRAVAVPGVEADELFRLAERQRAEQEPAHHAEDAGGRTDGHGQREHHDQSKSRAANQHAQSAANVLTQSVHGLERSQIHAMRPLRADFAFRPIPGRHVPAPDR